MVTTKRVPDNYEVKNSLAQKEYPKMGYKFKEHKTHVFRPTDKETQLKFGQKDFGLITHPDALNNPGHISEYNPLPKFWDEREQKVKLKKEISDGLEGKADWHMYHKKLPQKHVPISATLPDKLVKKEPQPFLQKEKWENAYTLLSRTINDSKIVGKPPVQQYFKRLKPEHHDKQFDGTHNPYLQYR
jgi:hypothetical protein